MRLGVRTYRQVFKRHKYIKLYKPITCNNILYGSLTYYKSTNKNKI